MTLWTRRAIYLTFTLIFFVVAPIIILYTSGFRWNFYKNELEKIGSLVIKTVPAHVNIQVGNINTYKRTPWRINNLTPNSYKIIVSKPGYYNWEKQLTIYSGSTTFAEHIYLFEKNPSLTRFIDKKINSWAYTKAKDFILYQANGQLFFYNFNLQKQEIINPLSELILDYRWSSDQEAVLLTTSSTTFAWRFSEPLELIDLNNKFSGSITGCKFFNSSNDSIICLDNSGLSLYNILLNNKTELVTSSNGNIIDFYWTNDNIYYLEKNISDQNIYLKIKNSNNLPTLPPQYQLPFSNSYKFIQVQNNLATILDDINQKLYLLSLYDEQDIFNKTSRIISDVSNAFYPVDDTLIYYNDREIWVLRNQQTSLITRQADTIKQVIWHPGQNHLLVVSEKGLKIIELDDRDKRNTAEIVNLEDIKKASFDKEAHHIIFSLSGKDNNLNGLYQVEILSSEEDVSVPTEKP